MLADATILNQLGRRLGDRLTVPSRLATTEFEIVGTVDRGAFSLQPVLYGSLQDWQQIRYGATDASVPEASFVLVKGGGDPKALAAGLTSGVPGVEAGTPSQTVDAQPGIAGIRNTVRAVVGFGLGVGALVIGAFFYVLTIQKVAQIGVLKALGATSWFVSRQLLLQVAVIAAAGLSLAVLAAFVTAPMLEGVDIPVRLTPGGIALTTVLLTAFALVAAAVSARRITRIDPLIALGQQQ